MLNVESPETIFFTSLLASLFELLLAATLLFLLNGSIRFPASLLRMGLGFSIACITYPIVGFDLMYGGELGSTLRALFIGDSTGIEFGDYSYLGDLIFQCRFVIASLMYLTLALGSSLNLPRLACLQVALAVVLYPSFGNFTWGGGWLDSLGFHDFSGAAIIGVAPATLALSAIYFSKSTNEHIRPKQLLLGFGILILLLQRVFAILALSYGNDTPLSYYAFETEIYTLGITLCALALASLYRKRICLEIAIACYLALTIAELAISIEYSPVLLVVAHNDLWHELALPVITTTLTTIIATILLSNPQSSIYVIPTALLIGSATGLLVEAYLNPDVGPVPQLAGILTAITISSLTALFITKLPPPKQRKPSPNPA